MLHAPSLPDHMVSSNPSAGMLCRITNIIVLGLFNVIILFVCVALLIRVTSKGIFSERAVSIGHRPSNAGDAIFNSREVVNLLVGGIS